MHRICAVLATPTMPIAVIASVAWAPVTGFPTWPVASRGRLLCMPAIGALLERPALLAVGGEI